MGEELAGQAILNFEFLNLNERGACGASNFEFLILNFE